MPPILQQFFELQLSNFILRKKLVVVDTLTRAFDRTEVETNPELDTACQPVKENVPGV